MTNDRVDGPSHRILVLIILTGVLHVAVELWSDGLKGVGNELARPQYAFNIAAAAGWGVYLLWRTAGRRGAVADLGFRREGFLAGIREGAVFAVLGGLAMIVFGILRGTFPPPLSFWIVLALYPAWGIAQQFALHALITSNLRDLLPRTVFRVAAVAVLFSASHFPETRLMVLTFVAGLFLTLIYERHRNVWAVGLIHGLLGTMAYYLVLGLDTGSAMLRGGFHPWG